MQKRKNAIRRLKIIHGQVEGLIKLLENEADCEKIFPQIKAIKNAFGGFSAEIMKEMMQECVIENRDEEKLKKMIEKFSTL